MAQSDGNMFDRQMALNLIFQKGVENVRTTPKYQHKLWKRNSKVLWKERFSCNFHLGWTLVGFFWGGGGCGN